MAFVTRNSNISEATRTIILTAAGGSPTETDGCSAPTRAETSGNNINYFALDFDQTNEEHAFWNVVMPDSYNGGTIRAIFFWTALSGAGTVIWGISARSFGEGDALDQAVGTEVTVTDTLTSTEDVHISPESGEITIAGVPLGGTRIYIEVSRKAGSDTLNADARLLEVRLEYQTSQFSD